MAPEDILFKTALDAIEKGERRRARDLLTRLLKANKKNPDYWVWMSAVVDSSRESIFCLKEALKLEPENQFARRGLILAGVLPVDEKLVVPYEKQRRDWQSQLVPKPSRMERLLQLPWGQQVAAGAGALVLVALMLMLGFKGVRQMHLFQGQSGTPAGLNLPRFVLHTPTPADLFPTATLPGPTPLSIFLESTYTPTPLYINTPHARAEGYRAAMRAYQRQEWADMQNYIQQAIEFDPDAPDLHYYLAEACRMQENYPAAAEAYQHALALDPSFAPAFLGSARLQLVTNPDQQEEIKAQVMEALKSDPAYVDAYLFLAEIHLLSGDPQAAGRALDSAEPLAPGSALVSLLRGKVALQLGDLDTALSYGLTAHQQDFTLVPVYRLLGEVHMALEQPGEALGYLITYALYVPEDPEVQVWLSRAHLAAGENMLALQTADRALRAQPQYLPALIQRGEVNLALEEKYDAIDSFQDALELSPNSFQASAGLGQAYFMAGLNRQAYNRLSQSLSLAENDVDSARIYFYRAQALEGLNEIVLAVRDWNALLALQSSSIPSEWIDAAKQHLAGLSTPTRTPRPSLSPTLTPDYSPTATFTATATFTPTRTHTATHTPTSTATRTDTSTATRTPTPTQTPTHTRTFTPSTSPTATPSFTPDPIF